MVVRERVDGSELVLERVDLFPTSMQSKSCELDPMPTTLLKKSLDYLLLVITDVVNSSLVHGLFPKIWKTAAVRPLIKKPGLSIELKNYRPVSNLRFLSKITEKAAMWQFGDHIESNSLLPDYQSAYRRPHERGVQPVLRTGAHEGLGGP